MRVMGLDLGSVTCGVSLSDPTGFLASPVTTLRFNQDDLEEARDLVMDLIKEKEPGKIVLGLPKHMNGDIGVRGEASMKFKELLEEETDIPVILWDERLTTVSAERELLFQDVSRKNRKKVIDQLAAVHILQSYLDSQ